MKRTNKGYIIPVILVVLLLIFAGFIYFSNLGVLTDSTINITNKTSTTTEEVQDIGIQDVAEEISTTTPSDSENSSTTDEISTTTPDNI